MPSNTAGEYAPHDMMEAHGGQAYIPEDSLHAQHAHHEQHQQQLIEYVGEIVEEHAVISQRQYEEVCFSPIPCHSLSTPPKKSMFMSRS